MVNLDQVRYCIRCREPFECLGRAYGHRHHGYCPDCGDKITARVVELRERREAGKKAPTFRPLAEEGGAE